MHGTTHTCNTIEIPEKLESILCLKQATRTCVITDIDECLTNNGGCGSECTNLNGTFSCACAAGEIDIDGDGVLCAGMYMVYLYMLYHLIYLSACPVCAICPVMSVLSICLSCQSCQSCLSVFLFIH